MRCADLVSAKKVYAHHCMEMTCLIIFSAECHVVHAKVVLALSGTPVYVPWLTVSHHPCRYLVDVRWMKQWKKFVGYDTWDRSQVGEDSANPGPIDNKSLLAGVCVCVHGCI